MKPAASYREIKMEILSVFSLISTIHCLLSQPVGSSD